MAQATQTGEEAIQLTYHDELRDLPVEQFALGGRHALIIGNTLEVLPCFPERFFDMIFADPPYLLSNDGITCHAGKMVSVNKGEWDRSEGREKGHNVGIAQRGGR